MNGPRWTIAPTTLRAVENAEAPRMIEGIAVPYGQVWNAGNGYAEMFAPGAFRDDVKRWNERTDGARLPFVRRHDDRTFLGGVTFLEDRPEGVFFRAELRDSPIVDDYLEEVRAGANGTSAEIAPIGRPMNRNGVTTYRRARLGAIAGALTPAYDAARVVARDEGPDMLTRESATDEDPTPTPDPEPEPTPTPEPPQADRALLEREAIRRTAPAVVTRPEFVYGPTSEFGFIRDVVLVARGDPAAADRQARHYRQLDEVASLLARAGDVLTSELVGAYPTEYLPGLLDSRILKGRPMGSFFSRIAITDARTRTFPKVTTSTTVAVQSAEGANPAASDFATTAETATPLLYGGWTKVSRQVIDGADPAAEAMIMSDLVESYAQASEAVIVAATETAAGAGTAAITAATPHDGTLAAVIEYFGARFLPAEGVFLPPATVAKLLTEEESTGRALIPFLNPSNASGQAEAGGSGATIAGVPVFLSWASAAGLGIVARRTDMVIYESAIARFSYEQPDGPAAIRLGLWAYLAAADRKGARKHTIA